MFNKIKGYTVFAVVAAAVLLNSCAANQPVKDTIAEIKATEVVSISKTITEKKIETATAVMTPTSTPEDIKHEETPTVTIKEEKAEKTPVEIKDTKSKNKKTIKKSSEKKSTTAVVKKTGTGNMQVDELIEKMNAAQADKIATKANVVIKTIYSGAQPQVVKGTAIIKKKDKFKIRYIEPQEQLLISDGKTIWIYTPAMQQAIKQSVQSANVDAKLYTDMGASIKHFAKNSKTEMTEDESAYNLVMIPEKGKSIPYDEITARIDKKSLYPVFMAMKYEGAATEITFSDTVNYTAEEAEKESDLANKNFIFTAPSGVEVIEAEELMQGMSK